MYNVHSARPGKCQKLYTNKIVRNQFGVKFTLSTVVKTHINSNIPIVITGPFHNFTTFEKSGKNEKNELELTSELRSTPTKVFTSGPKNCCEFVPHFF